MGSKPIELAHLEGFGSETTVLQLMFRLLRFILDAIYNREKNERMPKCNRDADLQNQMKLFMNAHGLTVGGVASRLGLVRSTLWRFCQTGMAREDTKVRYRAALANRDIPVVSDVAVSGVPAAIAPRHADRRGALAEQELRRIRSACEGVLALLDAYESQSLGNKI